MNAGFSTHELAAAERGRRALTVDELRSLAGSIGVELDVAPPRRLLRRSDPASRTTSGSRTC